MNDINMTVGDLRQIIKDLDDDTEVIVPKMVGDNCKDLVGFRYVRTAGMLVNKYEDAPALCFATAPDGIDMVTLIANSGLNSITFCEKVLF